MLGLTYDMVLAARLGRSHSEAIESLISGNNGKVLYDPHLGWVRKPKGTVAHHTADSKNTIRIAAFGDSFTASSEIERLALSSENLEILNFGVGGYGFDQTYLRYLQDGTTFDFHIVLIGFMTENSNRNLNVYRPFYLPIGRIACSKPRFKLANGELKLIKNPFDKLSHYQELLDNPKETLERLGLHDYYFDHRPNSGVCDFSSTVRLVKLVIWGLKHNHLIRSYISNGFYNEESEAFQITTRIFDKYYEAVLKNRSSPLIILFPRKADVYQYQRNKKKVYQPLIDYFDDKGYRFIDLLDAFDQQKPAPKTKDVFQPDGMHYNDKGNKIIRSYIHSYLARNYLQ
jgi:hypothetical protein